MQTPFYNKVKKLQEKVQDCKTREEIAQQAQALEVDVLVEYNSTTFFSFTQNLRDGMCSGSISFSVKANVTDGKTSAVGRSAVGCHVFGNDLTKEDIEREHAKSIIHTLQHLYFEEENNE